MHTWHTIYDHQDKEVGSMRLMGCKCCEYVMEIEFPPSIHPDHKILLIFVGHFLENIYR